ncbi:SARP family transcriptional regulator [Sphaerisporangium melleum]|uniref:SARP family transcriptional regulator n=1 Tax=Sphaerisporangium melleum TaxID=321316 RepID=A0A917QRK4_9ACTN|nr:BTAD domain-containing putative transcriptional regulator [Sphaerisporangium melleum]GGK64897.1 SARP family transcriptional regulator [Sphaerisporangium melleum]GII70025.1 SARP family transcriptional regulator [Sphaerisporangium melleum]
MRFQIMGPLRVRDGERDRTPATPKHRDLLAVFILNAGRPLTPARLRHLLWPREDGDRSDSLVRGYVGQLRRLLGEGAITTSAGTYTLVIGDDALDVDRFRRLVERGLRAARGGRDEQARSDLTEALDLWRGPVLEDVDPDGHRWVETPALREELEELRLLALERSVDLDLKAGRHRELVPGLRGLTRSHPLWQRFHGQYMLALYRSGRRVEALETYARLRAALDEGHAIEPDPELQLLYHRMLHDDVSLHVSAGPPVLLPHDIAHFTGRREPLERLDRLTADAATPARVVIHGQAGAGKSALAVHAAWQARDRFPDGLFYADLRGDHGHPADPGAVLEDLLRWLGCPAQAVPAGLADRERLFRAYTGGRRLLLLLDNAADEAQVRPLLASCPTFVTARSALAGLADAVRVPVEVLGDDDAAEVLTRLIGPERAKAERPAVLRLARLCGGLPMALRVAGARLAARPEWTVDHLAGLLADERRRLDLLHAGDQTVRGVYAIGYEGLPGKARRVLRSLGALGAPDFGQWVAEVFGDDAETLVDAGLLETHTIDVAGQVRYRLHDLTRLYAREQLLATGGPDAVRETLAHVLAVALTLVRASRFPLLSGMAPGPGTSFATTDIRRSVTWLAAERGFLASLVDDLHRAGLWDGCARLAHLLVPFLERHRFLGTWRRTGEQALSAARQAADPHAEALALRDLGDLHRAERHWDAAHERLRLALGMFMRAGRAGHVAQTRRRLGQVLLEQGRTADAERNLTACLSMLTGGDGDPDAAGTGGAATSERNAGEIAEARRALGAVLFRTGRLDDAAGQLSGAVSLLSGLGNRHGEADALLDLAEVNLAQRSALTARSLGERARGIAVRLGDRLLDARALLTLAEVDLAEGAVDRAAELAGEALRICQDVSDEHGRTRAQDLLRRAEAHRPSPAR